MKKKVATFNERLASVASAVVGKDGTSGSGKGSAGERESNARSTGERENRSSSHSRPSAERGNDRSHHIDRGYSTSAATIGNSSSYSSYTTSNNSYTATATNNSGNNNISNNSYSSYNANTSYSAGNNFDRWNASINHPSIHYESTNDGLLVEQLNNVKRDYEALKARYSELSKLRSTEAEEALAEHRRLSEARDAAAERTIKSLQTENERLKRELAEARQEAANKAQAAASEVANDSVSAVLMQEREEKISELQKLIKIYSGFSGLKIEVAEGEDEDSCWSCSFSSRSGRFEFTLRHDSSSNRYQYLPSPEATLIQSLPEFLTTDILIGADQMQIFFWRMLDTLTKERK